MLREQKITDTLKRSNEKKKKKKRHQNKNSLKSYQFMASNRKIYCKTDFGQTYQIKMPTFQERNNYQ